MSTILSPEHWATLSRQGWIRIPDACPPGLVQDLRSDMEDLRHPSKNAFAVAKIGQDGMIQDESTPFRDIRHSETCLLRRHAASSENRDPAVDDDDDTSLPLGPNATRTQLYEWLDTLRADLQRGVSQKDTAATNETSSSATCDAVALDESLEEVLYVYYPVGGYYRRHRDAQEGSTSLWRQFSFLLYVNDADWSDAADGGHLRLHRDSGDQELPPGEHANFVDLAPVRGTAIVFRSDRCPHEVLVTHRPRWAVVGWFLAQEEPPALQRPTGVMPSPLPQPREATYPSTIAPEVLQGLRDLRASVPLMREKLEPKTTPPDHTTGLFNDWGIVMETAAPAPPPPPRFEDTDPRYWKSIVGWDEEGRVSTLALGGQRLRKLAVEDAQRLLVNPALLGCNNVLDLGNTDLNLSVTNAMLDFCWNQRPRASLTGAPMRLTHVFLGGNALGDAGMQALLDNLARVQVLDLRYNDLTPGSAAALSTLLHQGSCEKLYLEGNRLGEEGVETMVAAREPSEGSCRLRELYLGQNSIGPRGGQALAAALTSTLGHLEKLYLEGNQIGPVGAEALTVVLKELGSRKVLQKLYVDNNGIGKEGSVRLGQALGSVTMVGEGGFYQN